MFDDEASTVDEEVEEKPREWSWVTFWSLVICGIGGWFQYVGSWIQSFAAEMDSHVAYKAQQKEFHRDVTYDLESIPVTSEPTKG